MAPGDLKDQRAERQGFDFRELWHSLLEKLWIVGLCTLAGLFLGMFYLMRTPKQYEGHLLLEVDVQEQSPMANGDNSARMRTAFLATQEAMRTIEQNLTNRTVLARVVRSEDLAKDGGNALLDGEKLENNSTTAPATATPRPEASVAGVVVQAPYTPLEEALAAYLSKRVRAVIRRGTRLIDVYVTNRDPLVAQRLAEALGREYIRGGIERRSSSNQETLRYLFEEEERLKKNLQKSEAAVAEYKANTPDALQLGGGAASTGSQAGAGSTGSRGGLVEDKLQELTSKLTGAKAERLRLEGELQQIDQAGEDVERLLAFPSIASATTVADRRRDLAQVEAAVATLSQRYKAKHPKMLAAQAALTEIKANLRRAVLTQPAVLRNTLEQARAAENNLGSAAQEQEKAALALNRAAIGYQELARQAETDRALYESVLRQIKETNLTKDLKTNAVSIVEHSPLARRPVSPSPIKSTAAGLLGGLLAGLGFVYVSSLMDRSLKTVDQAEAISGLPVLAAVPEVKNKEASENGATEDDEAGSRYRLVAEAPEGPAAESFRNLRASLSLLGPEVDRKIFIFTSASPEEGKSFTSANYALSLAQQGYNVLLIDGDMRRPTLHKIFQPTGSDSRIRNRDEPLGIVDYMVGGAELRSVIRAVSSSRLEPALPLNGSKATPAEGSGPGQLWLLAGGRRAPNPAELLSGNAFPKLLADAREQFDRIIIDSAPILAVSDTLLMAPHVQSVCLVVRAARTPRNAVVRSLAMLETSGARPVGLVLNRLPRRRGAGYYYYYAAHGYGVGEGSYADHYRPRVVDSQAEAADAARRSEQRRPE